MAQDKISPEEKLLNLIKGDKIKGKEKSEEKKKIKRPRKIIFLRLDGRYLTGHRPVLMFIIILLFCFIGYESRPDIRMKNRKDFLRQNVKREKSKAPGEPAALKSYSYYSQEIQGKSLFSPLVIEKTAAPVERTEKIEEMCKGYQIKGIILGARPEAFIEDTQARRTFTVTIGDTIGKVQVKDIKEGRVTLEYENETYDLSF